MEPNNGTVPQEQPNEITAAQAQEASGEQIVTSYGVVSREYVETLIQNSVNTKSKPKKSVGKRILAWFFGIVGGATFLVLCLFLCFNAYKLTDKTETSGSSTYDEDFFYIPDFFYGYDDGEDEEEETSATDTPVVNNSDAGLGVVVTQLDTSSAQMYGISGGLVILGIESDSSFVGTDVKEYDIITGAEGVEITSTTTLSGLLAKHQVGDEFTVTITRFVDGFAESFDVTVSLINKNA